MPTRVLGIDPGVSETGWALLTAETGGPPKFEAAGLIKTFPRELLPARLHAIHNALSAVILRYAPDSVAVEEMFFMQAAHTVRATLQARGVVLLAAAQAGKSISEYNPRTVKLALTGSGTAAKAQMQKVVQTTLALDKPLRPDDVADAAAIAICHLRSQRFKRLQVLDHIGGRPK
jgi:crossover junction endodeoxyribonuclease RuvC